MKKIIKSFLALISITITYSVFAIGGGINSVPGFSETDPYFNFSGSGTTFKTTVKDLGSIMSYNTFTKQLFIIDNATGQLKVYSDGSTTPLSTNTLYTGLPLQSVGMNYHKQSGYTTIVGLTQGNGTYLFPSDAGSFTANAGDIVILKVNSAGALLDYSYIQKKTGTSYINPNFHKSINTAAVGGAKEFTYIGGSIDGKGILFEIEGTTGDISRIVQFSSTVKVYGAMSMSSNNKIAVAVKFDAARSNMNSILEWNTTTNTFDSQIDLANTDNIYDMVWQNSTTGHVLFDYTANTATIGSVNLTNPAGRNSVLFTLNLSNNTPQGSYVDLGNNSPNDIKLTRLSPSSTGEQFLYANGDYVGSFSWFDPSYNVTAGRNGILTEFNVGSGVTIASYFVSNLVPDNNITYTTFGDAVGTFYATDSNGYMYKFGDASNVSRVCAPGFTATEIPYKVNLTTGIVSRYGDQAAIQAYLSSTNTGAVVGNDTNSSAEVERIEGTFNGIVSSPSYVLNYGFNTTLGKQYFGGFAKSLPDPRGWAGMSIQQIKQDITDTLALTGNPVIRDALVSTLRNNLKDNASISTVLGQNPGSYGYYFQSKGIDITIIDGTNPFYSVDFYNPETADRAKLNAGTYSSYYLAARGVNNSRWKKDTDIRNATSGSAIGANDIVWTPLNRGTIYVSDSEFPQLIFPIKKKNPDGSLGSIEAYVEFSCGNLLCKDYTKECLAPSTSTKDVANCGNSKLDLGEECEKTGQIIPNGIKQALPWYDYSCSNTCKIVADPKPALTTSVNEAIINVTACKRVAPVPPSCNPLIDPTCAQCQNGVIEAGEQCEPGVGAGTLNNCNQYSCQNIGAPPPTQQACSVVNISGQVRYDQGQECSPDILNSAYDVNCSDGINFPSTPACYINRPSTCGDGKIDLSPTNRTSETCDYGTSNLQIGSSWNVTDETNLSKTISGVQCSNSCKEIRSVAGPSLQVCGDGVLQATNGEQCEISTVNGSTIWDPLITNQATASGFPTPEAMGWLCSGTGGLTGLAQCKAQIPPVCGNNRLDVNEQCDGGVGCYGSGGIAGRPELACTYANCGNGVVEPSVGELCEPSLSGSTCDPISCKFSGSGATGLTAECKENVAFEKTYNFLTFNSKTFNGTYEIWTWNGTKFTSQKIKYPNNTDVLERVTKNVEATVNLKTYMTNNFVPLLLDNRLLVPKSRVFSVKNRYLDNIALQSVFFDANKVIGGGYVKTGFKFLTDFYNDGVKTEIQALSCADSAITTRQAVTNIIGVIDTDTEGVYLIKSWGSSLPDSTSFWKDRSLGQSSIQ